jgi:phosphatidylglycerophosphate synthase
MLFGMKAPKMNSAVIKRVLPSVVTLIRLAAAPLFYYIFLHCSCVLAIIVFALAAFSDVLDGFLARRLGVSSDAGAYFDVIADFVLVVAAFAAFSRRMWYGWIVFVPILASFACFVLSSGAKRPVYDPVGKYMGGFLMAMIGLTLLAPFPLLRKAITITLLSFCGISLAFRFVHAFRRGRGGIG